MATFDERLKGLRNSRGWSQDVLADKLGTTRSCIGNYEQGKRKPDIETLEQIADLFNVDMAYLTGSQSVQRKSELSTIIPSTDVDVAYEKLQEIRRSIHDIPVNHEIFTQAMKKKGVTIDGLAMLSGVDLKVIEGIAYNTYPFVNFDELGKLNKMLGDIVDWKANAIAKDTFYKNIMTSLLDIQPFLGNTKLTDDEVEILTKYRSSDELTQAMVKRTLGIE